MTSVNLAQSSLFTGGDTPPVATRYGSETPPGVLRIIEAKTGPFTEIRNGEKTGREFRVLELHSGQLVCEWTDTGERFAPPPTCSRIFIADGLHVGTMREVRP